MINQSKILGLPRWEVVGIIVVFMFLLFGVGVNIYESWSSKQSAKKQTENIILAIYQVDTVDTFESHMDLMDKRNDFEDSFELELNTGDGEWVGAAGGESVYEFWNYNEEEILSQIKSALEKVDAKHFKVQKRWYENDDWQNEFILEQ